jgi:hypothetical protein
VSEKAWPPIALAAGILLMLAASLLVALVPEQAVWSDADAASLQKASADWHGASHQHNHAAHAHESSHAEQGNSVAAQSEYERQQARLNAAQSRGRWLVWGLRLLGITIAAVGVWGYVQTRK